MILADQPTIFSEKIVASVSSVSDGSMRWGTGTNQQITQNRQSFLQASHMPADVALVQVIYEGNNYCRYESVSKPEAVTADALSTQAKNLPLFLPLADCTGAIIYDPVKDALMVSHLGRHSTEQFGGQKSIEFMIATYQSKPENLLVWLSPSPGQQSYPLWSFNNRSFSNVLSEQMQSVGVLAKNMQLSQSDTVTNPNYFSHSQFLKGQQEIDGRYAVAAMLI